MILEFTDIEKPKIKEKSNLQLLSGNDVPDIKIFSLVSEDDFELMTEQCKKGWWYWGSRKRYICLPR